MTHRALVTRLVRDLAQELARADTDTFGALIARDEPPQAFTRRPWAGKRVSAVQAAGLLGLTVRTFTDYGQRGKKARSEGRESPADMPASGDDGLWPIGDLALWLAIRRSYLLAYPRWPASSLYEEQVREAIAAKVSTRELAAQIGVSPARARALMKELGAPGRARVPDSDLIPLVNAFLAATEGRRARVSDVIAILREHGHPVSKPRAGRLITACGGTAITPADADTAEGHVRAATLARAAGCSPQRITAAVAEQRLTPASRDRHGAAFDLKWVKPGTGHLKAPADSWWQPVATGPDGKILPPAGGVLPPAWGFAAAVGWLRRDLAQASPQERESWLAATPEGTPPTFGRHGWMWIPLPVGEAAALAHTTENAVMRSGTFPDPSGEDDDGEPAWTAGQVALWMASLRSSSNETCLTLRRNHDRTRTPGSHRRTD